MLSTLQLVENQKSSKTGKLESSKIDDVLGSLRMKPLVLRLTSWLESKRSVKALKTPSFDANRCVIRPDVDSSDPGSATIQIC